MHGKKSEYVFYICDPIGGSLQFFFFIFSNVVRVYILQCQKKIDMAAFTSVLQLPRAELLKAWFALTIG